MLRNILSIVLIIICVVITVLVLMQEGKQEGLGTLSGQALEGTYWSKNKKRSREGRLIRGTALLCVLWFVLCLLLDMKLF